MYIYTGRLIPSSLSLSLLSKRRGRPRKHPLLPRPSPQTPVSPSKRKRPRVHPPPRPSPLGPDAPPSPSPPQTFFVGSTTVIQRMKTYIQDIWNKCDLTAITVFALAVACR